MCSYTLSQSANVKLRKSQSGEPSRGPHQSGWVGRNFPCSSSHRHFPPIRATHEVARTAEQQKQQQDDADTVFMQIALQEATKVGDGGEVPIGAVMVHEGRVVSLAGNAMEGSGDPTQHAELLAIQDTVRKLGRHRMLDCTMYVTLEPCPMCAGALLQARVGSLVYAAKNPLLGADGSWIWMLRKGKGGCEVGGDSRQHPFHPNMEVRDGILADESALLMKEFFRRRRLQVSTAPHRRPQEIKCLED